MSSCVYFYHIPSRQDLLLHLKLVLLDRLAVQGASGFSILPPSTLRIWVHMVMPRFYVGVGI